ncbi:MAG: hypothetical protein UR83_C0021G0001 [Candidatus Moranbacteria bacterium GW2011_GWF2_35_54]|nr:MAG: hypothetical protein UR83_C0021G0001 [Candidatus Moranbacteria bacterium GW2011_GWF2_35_54]
MLIKYWRLILFVLVVAGLIYAIGWSVNKFILKGKWGSGETKTYQILVAVYDEKNSNPIEDKKSSMKKGYVIGVYGERKIKLNEKEAQKIVEPVEKEIDKKTLSEEQKKMMKEEKNPEVQKEVVAARKYKIDLEKIGFSDPNSLLKGQPFEGRVFGWEVVTKAN